MATGIVNDNESFAARSTAVSIAVAIAVIMALSTPLMFILPGADDIPAGAIAIGVAASVITLVSAWGLWNLRRWGAIVTFVVTLLNLVAALPGLLDPPSAWLAASIVISIPLSLAVLILIALPSSRRSYR
jgi:uncharacterized membrane protein (DUF2068 family)